MKPILKIARAVLRIWCCMVLGTTLAGAAVCGFGLYTVLVIGAPFRWLDQILHFPVNGMFLTALMAGLVFSGVFMLKLGHKTLARLAVRAEAP